jgi:hypothetical protein
MANMKLSTTSTSSIDHMLAKLDALRPDTKIRTKDEVTKRATDEAAAIRRWDLGMRDWMQRHPGKKADWPPLTTKERKELEQLQANFEPDPIALSLADHWNVGTGSKEYG